MSCKQQTNRKGDAFEKRTHDYFAAEIAADRFFAKKECCRLFWKKGYYSKDRNSNIIFDVAIEFYLPGADEFSTVLLIECKDYSSPIPVEAVEEFFTKVQQVSAARAKAVFVSTAPFQRGAREFAHSKGMGLIRCFGSENFKWELKRSPSGTTRSTSAEASYLADIALSDPAFVSTVFDLFLQTPIRETNSLSDFIEDVLVDSGISPTLVRSLANPKRKISNRVPFIEKDELESRSLDLLQDLGYSGGEVDLDAICRREKVLAGLTTQTNVAPGPLQAGVIALGRISFAPLLIEIFATQPYHRARERFTLAHELAHHLLNHGNFMSREYCDEGDFVLYGRSTASSSDIARLEFQANYFAACLLMPGTYLLRDFQQLARDLDIVDQGFGPLYLDKQACNIQTFLIVTNHYMQRYGVSRAAVKVRLESLGVMREERELTHVRQVLRLFGSNLEE